MTILTFVVHTVQQDEVDAVMGDWMHVRFLSWAHCVTVMTSVTGRVLKTAAQTSGVSVWALSLLYKLQVCRFIY
jgi:hypothetical protein